MMARATGEIVAGGLSKHMDTVIHSQSTSKVWEAETWTQEFSGDAPKPIAFGLDPANPGKKVGVKDVTTTGFSVYYEVAAQDVCIFGRQEGYE